MKEKKVRNRFLQVVSYILRGLTFLMCVISAAVLTLFALVRIGDRIPNNPGAAIKEIYNEAFADIPISVMLFFWGAIALLIFAYVLWVMAKLVSNVSKDIIFDRINVKYLRRMMIATLISSFVNSGDSFIDLQGLFLALTFFLFSLILSRAITIAEEQEFTV